jgi:hypothetical protein
MAYKLNRIRRILEPQLSQLWKYEASSILPGLEEPHVHSTICTLMLRFVRRFFSAVVRRRVRHILLRYSTQIDNRIGDAVGTAEGHHNSRLTSHVSVIVSALSHTVINSDIAATVTE